MKWEPAQLVTDLGGYDPNIAYDKYDNLHAVWGIQAGFIEDLYYTCRTQSGWTAPVVISDESFDLQRPSGIAADSSGAIHAIWLATDFQDDPQVHYKRWSGSWSSEALLGPASNFDAGIAADAIGSIHIVRGHNRDIYYKVRNGDQWSQDLILNQSPLYEALAIAASFNGGIHVIWFSEDQAISRLIYKSKINGIWFVEQPLITLPSGERGGLSKIHCDVNNDVHVLYITSGPTSSYTLYHMANTDGHWSQPVILTSWEYPAYTMSYAIAADSTGRTNVAFSDELANLLCRGWEGGEWSPATAIASPGVHVALASVRTETSAVWLSPDPNRLLCSRGSRCAVGEDMQGNGFPSNVHPCTEGPPTGPYYEFDDDGNAFLLECANAFFCSSYDPVDGPPRMISKCPWFGGLNKFHLFGVAGTEPPTPRQWSRAIHTSYDYYPIGTSICALCGDCEQDPTCLITITEDNFDDQGYCDDYPPTGADGYYDWLVQEYDACNNQLNVSWWCSQDGEGDGDQDGVDLADLSFPIVEGEILRGTCNFDKYFPYGQDLNPACRYRTGSAAMHLIGSAVYFSGMCAGGDVTLVCGDRSVTATTTPGESPANLVDALAEGVNNSPEYGALGVTALASENMLTLLGAGRDRLSIVVTDPGIEHPSAPDDFRFWRAAGATHLAWRNRHPYDVINILRSGVPVKLNLPGTKEEYVDSTGVEGTYDLIAWRNGMASELVTATESAADVGEGHLAQGKLIIEPNPMRTQAIITYKLGQASHARIEIYDCTGRSICRLVDQWNDPGFHSVTLRQDRSNCDIRPGIYYVRLRTAHTMQTGTLVIVK